MSKQTTLKVRPSLKKKVGSIDENLEDLVYSKLTNIARTAVDLSPIDTGAYITSHSFQTNTSSRGRGKSSRNRPKRKNDPAMAEEGMNNLVEDINALDLTKVEKITLRNDSPHAQVVEIGGPNWTKAGYFVYDQVRNIHG